MLGSGVFFTPGELAAVAQAPWQVYFLWTVCGLITLSGALTLAELTCLLPQAGASYHIIREGFGPFWAFLKIWIEMWVSGPGSVAGVAIIFGEFAVRLAGDGLGLSAPLWGAAAIAAFTVVNLLGIQWGGRTQVALTAAKLLGLLGLVGGSLLWAAPASPPAVAASTDTSLVGLAGVVGLGVAAVLFTYDGWVDVTHVAGEVRDPRRNLPVGLGAGVLGVTGLYLVVNYAFLRVVPLESMRENPTGVASAVAAATFGPAGGQLLTALMTVSIVGALGGLVMTLPRLYYAAASQYDEPTRGRAVNAFFRGLSVVSPRKVPSGAVLFSATLSTGALLFFSTFREIVTFFVVPLQLVNVLMVAAIFRLRGRAEAGEDAYRAPGYPWLPLVYIVVLSLLLVSAALFNPRSTLIGAAMTATGIPVYFVIARRRR
jgi:APA family basic amino acid/polyamine antiporter